MGIEGGLMMLLDVMCWDLDARVLPIACLFEGQPMGWKHRTSKEGTEPHLRPLPT